MEREKFYLTTAIAYTSRKPHIGNTYEIVLADAIARFKRFEGYDVFMLTGTDEHGQKIQELAEKAGISPKEYVDKVAGEIRRIWDLMNASYDKFIRTTDDYHIKSVQKIFKKLYEQGDIYLGKYEGMYCTPCESFWTETQLVDGKCPDCHREVHRAEEEAYFFRMSKYRDRLMEYIESHPDFICPESGRKEMINNFIKPGLQDLCVSRTSFTWGIPVEFSEGHVVYVWLDALTNYINALGYSPDGESGDLFKKYWPADVHIIGKDILRFHTIYWPIILMALGEELPKRIFGHPWLLNGESKMSKSTGNVLYADDLVKHFGVDAVRFYLLCEMPYAQDGTITYEKILTNYNTYLANSLGNLVNRTVSMVKKYFNGVIPSSSSGTEFDTNLKEVCINSSNNAVSMMDEYKTADAINEIFKIVNRANKYIDETTPWVLAKDESKKEILGTVLYNLLEAIRISASLLSPFMPSACTEIAKQINSETMDFESIKTFGSKAFGETVGEPKPIFARIDAEKKLEELEKEFSSASGADAKEAEDIKTAPFKDKITIEDFEKLDIRVGRVLECEKVPKSSKLLKFILKAGNEKRRIVSGIAKYYKPEELIGKNVLFIANLPTVKLAGIESEGMILSAEYEGKLTVTTTEGEIESGAVIC